MKKYTSHSLFVLLIALSACVKPYYPDIDKYDKIIVIDGFLADDGTPPVVTLSYSFSAESPRVENISGAHVTISSASGARYVLTEKTKGLYTYIGQMFDVQAGMAFQLLVEYEGKSFYSSLETIQPVAPISELTTNVNLESGSEGVDVFLSSSGNPEQSKYYAWSFDETWKFRVPLITATAENKRICYASSSSRGINIGTTESYADNNFLKRKILTISNKGPRLSIRYSALVKQYSLTRNTYMYLQHVKQTNESNGSLFDPIPSSMNGNVTSSDAPVIGNFQVSSVSSRRIFIDRTELNGMFVEPGMKECEQELATEPSDSLVSLGYVLMDVVTIEQTRYYRYASALTCFDCTATGAPNTPPSWWVEKE